jgi:hypothetical protein
MNGELFDVDMNIDNRVAMKIWLTRADLSRVWKLLEQHKRLEAAAAAPQHSPGSKTEDATLEIERPKAESPAGLPIQDVGPELPGTPVKALSESSGERLAELPGIHEKRQVRFAAVLEEVCSFSINGTSFRH